MSKKKILVLTVLFNLFLGLFLFGVVYAKDKVLELRNSTSRTIWVAKSYSYEENKNNLQWTSLASGNWGAWNVTEGGYLYFAYAKKDDLGQREKVFYAQLPYHQHYRWFWMVIANGNSLQLTADYERAKGRDPYK